MRIFFIVLIIISSCAQESGTGENKFLTILPVTSPAGINTEEPNLFYSDNGGMFMSWINKSDDSATLIYSLFNENKWLQPVSIASGDDWFVNWADFPSLVRFQNGGYAAHYLQKSGPGSYAYGVRISFSEDGFKWSDPIIPHRDGTDTEHGFVSLIPLSSDNLMAIWLDGRDYAKPDKKFHQMTLRSAIIDRKGNLLSKAIIDERVCDCCQTDAVLTDNGPVVVYRDRSNFEIRDISISRFQNNQWATPEIISQDGWEINACPVNGPAIDSDGNYLGVTWFTASKGIPKILVKLSDDGGESFGPEVQIDSGNPLGRVDLVMMPEGSAIVSWLEAGENDDALIMARQINQDGFLLEPVEVYHSKASRASGFPRMVRNGSGLFFAWTVPSTEGKKVMTARGILNNSGI